MIATAPYPQTDVKQPFQRTARQQQATEFLKRYRHTMLYGGSRSGKTFIIIYAMVVRALRCHSRHLIVRFRFNHVKRSIWHDTLPKVMKLCFPEQPWSPNEKYGFIQFANGSQIWFGGIDDKERTEQILGNEYSTIFPNECSQISYEAVVMMQTRLAEQSGLVNKMFYDCNPPSKKHWTHQLFIEHIDPLDRTPLDTKNYGMLLMNPEDNRANIADGYIEEVLMKMPRRQRDRFLHGLFLSDIEGALWTTTMIDAARAKRSAEIVKTVVGVDPSVTNTNNSDLCGIIVASRDRNGEALVEKDYSLRASPNGWAHVAVDAYHTHKAAYIVAEVNQGGDLVETVIHSIDNRIKVVKVHASRGKFARAEPISALYEQGKVAHADGLDDLETEMMEYVPLTGAKSPDRMDACVHALSDLFHRQANEPRIRIA